jgi:hypothetical protein
MSYLRRKIDTSVRHQHHRNYPRRRLPAAVGGLIQREPGRCAGSAADPSADAGTMRNPLPKHFGKTVSREHTPDLRRGAGSSAHSRASQNFSRCRAWATRCWSRPLSVADGPAT